MKRVLRWASGLVLFSFLSLSNLAFANGPVNINAATTEQLSTLRGIGQVRAEAIIKYRDAHGPFQSIEELKDVAGIGDKIIEDNRSRIQLHDNEAATQGIKAGTKGMRANTKH